MSAALLLLPLGMALGAGGVYLYNFAEQREEEAKGAGGACKEAKWKEQICLGSRFYIGETVTKDKIPMIPKGEASAVLGKLSSGPFRLSFEFADTDLPKLYVLESDLGFIIAEDGPATTAGTEKVARTLDDSYHAKKWMQAIKPEHVSNRFADRFPTRTVKHATMDGGAWGITVVKEADASVKLFAYAFWDAPTKL